MKIILLTALAVGGATIIGALLGFYLKIYHKKQVMLFLVLLQELC